MSLTRRGILSLLGMGAATAASGSSPREAAKALGLLEVPAPHINVKDAIEAASPEVAMAMPDYMNKKVPSLYQRIDEVGSIIWQKKERESHPERMPLNIRNKKSWSPAFKDACWAQDDVVMRAFTTRLNNDASFAKQVFTSLGLDFFHHPEEEYDRNRSTIGSAHVRF